MNCYCSCRFCVSCSWWSLSFSTAHQPQLVLLPPHLAVGSAAPSTKPSGWWQKLQKWQTWKPHVQCDGHEPRLIFCRFVFARARSWVELHVVSMWRVPNLVRAIHGGLVKEKWLIELQRHHLRNDWSSRNLGHCRERSRKHWSSQVPISSEQTASTTFCEMALKSLKSCSENILKRYGSEKFLMWCLSWFVYAPSKVEGVVPWCSRNFQHLLQQSQPKLSKSKMLHETSKAYVFVA